MPRTFIHSEWTVQEGTLVPAEPDAPDLFGLPDGTPVTVLVPGPEEAEPVDLGVLTIAEADSLLAIRYNLAADTPPPPGPTDLYIPKDEVEPLRAQAAVYVQAISVDPLRVDFDPAKSKHGLVDSNVHVPFLEAHGAEGVDPVQTSVLKAYRVACRIVRPDRDSHGSNVFDTVFHYDGVDWKSLRERREEARQGALYRHRLYEGRAAGGK